MKNRRTRTTIDALILGLLTICLLMTGLWGLQTTNALQIAPEEAVGIEENKPLEEVDQDQRNPDREDAVPTPELPPTRLEDSEDQENPQVMEEQKPSAVPEKAMAPLRQNPANQAVDFDLEYDKPVQCGTATTLRVVPKTGDLGDYWYLLSSISLNEDGIPNIVFDPSARQSPYKNFQKDGTNSFQFTFYASGTYTVTVAVMTASTPHQLTRKHFTIEIKDPQYPTIEQRADQIAQECLKTCHTDYDKAVWMHDWLVNNMVYDYRPMMYCHAEGALGRKTGTCEAYHRAYCMLLKRVGVETNRVEGNGHVWTAVKIDGQWCQVDVTWDDNGWSPPQSDENYLYMGLNDALMKVAHSDHNPNPNSLSNTLENNFYIRSGRVSKWTNAFQNDIQTQLDAGTRNFKLPVKAPIPNAGDPPTPRTIIFTLTAYALSQQAWTAGNVPCKLEATYLPDTNEIQFVATPTAVTPSPVAIQGFTVKKILQGRDWRNDQQGNPEAFQFKLNVLGCEGEGCDDAGTLPQEDTLTISSASQPGQGAERLASYGTMTFAKPGQYTFMIEEIVPVQKEEGMTYDTEQKEVAVLVTTNQQGKLEAAIQYPGQSNWISFTNIYRATTYAVRYQFESEEATQQLPVTVMDLLPTTENGKANGQEITPTPPGQTEVSVADGKWTFKGYTPRSARIEAADVQFVGKWAFVKKTEPSPDPPTPPTQPSAPRTDTPTEGSTGRSGFWTGRFSSVNPRDRLALNPQSQAQTQSRLQPISAAAGKGAGQVAKLPKTGEERNVVPAFGLIGITALLSWLWFRKRQG